MKILSFHYYNIFIPYSKSVYIFIQNILKMKITL